MRRQIFKEVQRRKMKTAVKMALTAAAAAALAAAVAAAGVFMVMRKKQEDKEKEGEDHPQYWENVGGRWVFWGKLGNKWTEETGWIDADVEIYPEEMREEWIEELQRESLPERSSRSRSRSRSRSTDGGDVGDGGDGGPNEIRTVMVDQMRTHTMITRGRGMIPAGGMRPARGMMPGGGVMPGGGRAGPSDPSSSSTARNFRSPDLRPDLSADEGQQLKWIDCRKLEMTLSDVLKIIRKEGCTWVTTSKDRSYAVIDEIGVEWQVWENGYFKQRARL